jgi:NAD(P)-dependent dehydrogenase (short-subunit alcohol dehydrogenase family)
LPAIHVDHVHADAICILTNQPEPEEAIRRALGDVPVVPYLRPGFELSRRVAEHADAGAVVLLHHGLVTWSDSDEASYARTIELVARARAFLDDRHGGGSAHEPRAGLDPAERQSFLAAYRGRLSRSSRRVLHVDESQRALADREDVALVAQGRATPDHVMSIGIRTLAPVADPSEVAPAVDAYTDSYREFYERNAERVPSGYAMLDPLPKVALVPGLGCVAAAASAKAARSRAEIAFHSHSVTAEALDAFGATAWLDDAELADIEYWPLELYKLSLAPPAAELAGTIAIVTGAGSGIGREIACDLVRRGAHVVVSDIDERGLEETHALLDASRVLSVAGDVTDEAVVDRLVGQTVESFGGVDAVVSNAGVAMSAPLAEIPVAVWRQSLEINTTAHFLLTRRVWPVFERQGIGGTLVYVASKNAFGPGAGFGAYSVAKAAEVQLARIAAIEGGPIGVRANAVNPDAIFAGSKLWSDDLRRQRAAAHGIDPDELQAFYAERNLLKMEVTGADVAETVAFLVSERSRATTGCVLTVDGGVAAAFPR